MLHSIATVEVCDARKVQSGVERRLTKKACDLPLKCSKSHAILIMSRTILTRIAVFCADPDEQSETRGHTLLQSAANQQLIPYS